MGSGSPVSTCDFSGRRLGFCTISGPELIELVWRRSSVGSLILLVGGGAPTCKDTPGKLAALTKPLLDPVAKRVPKNLRQLKARPGDSEGQCSEDACNGQSKIWGLPVHRLYDQGRKQPPTATTRGFAPTCRGPKGRGSRNLEPGERPRSAFFEGLPRRGP
jgi:hypothetical protein